MTPVDDLSSALAALRIGRSTVRRFRQNGSWGLDYSGLTGSGFHVILRGAVWLLTTDAPPVALHPGDVVLITSGVDHALASEPRPLSELPSYRLGEAEPRTGPAADFEFICGAYRLTPGRHVHPFLADLPDPIVVPSTGAPDPMIDLLDEQQAAGLVVDATRHALLDLVLTRALSRWLETADRPTTSDPLITTAVRAVDTSPETRWTVQELSRRAGLSRATFTRRFTAAVGRPPTAYLRAHRLDRAARLLVETDETLAAIARRTGYSTEFALAGAFRREYGLAPGAYRRKHR